MVGLGVTVVIALAMAAIVAIGVARRQRVRQRPGIVIARRIRLAFRQTRLLGGKALLAVGGRLPIGRGGRRRVRRRPSAGELRERIVLPDQSGQLGERIAAAGVVALARRAPGAPRGIVRSVGSQRIIVRHTHSVSGTGAALGRFCNVPHSGTERDQRISSGASTPSKANPDARTMTTPCTRARRAIVICGSFWIMKRK